MVRRRWIAGLKPTDYPRFCKQQPRIYAQVRTDGVYLRDSRLLADPQVSVFIPPLT